MQKSTWLVAGIAGVLCAGVGVLLFGNQNAGISGTNELADRFITQLALETYRPGWGGDSSFESTEGEARTGDNTGLIDLSLKKELAGYSNNFYLFLLTVSNNGTEKAMNFTVKDYIPYGWLFEQVFGGTSVGGTAMWNVDSLSAGQSKQLRVSVKRKNALLVNKAEVCDYEEEGEPYDLDSDPCNMRPLGSPKQDDEDMVTILTGSTGASHLACVNQACVYVAGAGANTCNNNSGCIIANTGNNNTGVVNTGNTNTGSTNTGNNNTGVVNSGNTNTGINFTTGCKTMVYQTGRTYDSGNNIYGEVIPYPLPSGWSYLPVCTVTNIFNPSQTWQLQVNIYGYMSWLWLWNGSYMVSCGIVSPAGQVFYCPNTYINING